ncbi:MAG: isoprenylcysteine carboxylmethyltransferase family protein [Alphaproteobacteria bacterium]|nr:isoprenylcysteine carboxylmethyltransferase family protein [Alphaproteobacteria bacterium]
MGAPLAHLGYAVAWLTFGLVHSLLAREGVKARLSGLFGRGYRLAYNLFALAHLGAVLAVGRIALGALPGFDHPVWLAVTQGLMLAAGAVVLAVALRGYDLGLFAGTRQLREGEAADQEPLRLDGLHRYVRHPLYAGVHLALWGLATSPLGLATAAWASAYLVIGAMFEERALVRRYGAAYERYRRQVPAIIPWRGRAI